MSKTFYYIWFRASATQKVLKFRAFYCANQNLIQFKWISPSDLLIAAFYVEQLQSST